MNLRNSDPRRYAQQGSIYSNQQRNRAPFNKNINIPQINNKAKEREMIQPIRYQRSSTMPPQRPSQPKPMEVDRCKQNKSTT